MVENENSVDVVSGKTPWTPGPWTVTQADHDVAERANVLWGRAINGPHVAAIAAAIGRSEAQAEMAEVLGAIKSQWSFYSDTALMGEINALLAKIGGSHV